MRERVTEHKSGGLQELPATAICGNDITSSCLYVSALAIVHAGKWAWVSLSIVAGVLFLYRRIYAEVVGALPLNGGAYNALLNTTSKSLASMAACLTILSQHRRHHGVVQGGGRHLPLPPRHTGRAAAGGRVVSPG